MNEMELIEVDDASAMATGEQNVGKAMIPMNIGCGKRVPSMDRLGKGFI